MPRGSITRITPEDERALREQLAHKREAEIAEALPVARKAFDAWVAENDGTEADFDLFFAGFKRASGL